MCERPWIKHAAHILHCRTLNVKCYCHSNSNASCSRPDYRIYSFPLTITYAKLFQYTYVGVGMVGGSQKIPFTQFHVICIHAGNYMAVWKIKSIFYFIVICMILKEKISILKRELLMIDGIIYPK